MNDVASTKIACGILADLNNNENPQVPTYFEDFVPCLFNLLVNQDVDRNLKIPAISALGAMSLCYDDKFNLKYLEKLLNILNMAASMSVENLENYVNDPDSQEFCKELRDELLD